MLHLHMREWEHITYAENPELAGFSLGDDTNARTLTENLAKAGFLEIVELRHGLSVRSTSYVGRLQLGELQLTIQPKIRFDVLLALFRYAYRLGDLRLVTHGKTDAEPDAFQDTFIEQLILEVTKLLSRGLHRHYRKSEGNLANSKGQIDIQKIARRAGAGSADIPVSHYPRLEDNLLNQMLLAGLKNAILLTTNLEMKARLRRLASRLECSISPVRLDAAALTRLRRQMNRLTAHYEPAIALIELLVSSTGITLEATNQQITLPGFLFDMNLFFERLLSRFLNENLPAYTVHDQYELKGVMAYSPDHNPKRRRSPTPRPDFVITREKTLISILDAKYRDLWEKSLPRDMLYQLAIYALSQGWNGRSIILYPAVTDEAVPQIIEINEAAFASANQARVILTPVRLAYLSELLRDDSPSARAKRAAYAESLIQGSVHVAG